MKHKTIIIGMVLILIGLSTVYFSIKPKKNTSAPTSATSFINAGNDEKMQTAFNKARDSLERFLSIAKNQPEGTQGYSLKVGVKQNDAIEFFWIYPFEESADGYSGRVNDTPKIIDSVFQGEVISFARGQIVDWTYDDKNTKTMHGNFTGCVQVLREAPDNAEQFMKLYGLNCED